MKTKKDRLSTILYLIENQPVGKQGELLDLLSERGFSVTQATLSRDINQLKLIKKPNYSGHYIYTVSEKHIYAEKKNKSSSSIIGFISLEFSGNLAVIKTRPGYAMSIASEIDNTSAHVILGTIAGDDTILLIPRENMDKQTVKETLATLLPEIIQK
jgi:transcriptional regulator of arginine metabolism